MGTTLATRLNFSCASARPCMVITHKNIPSTSPEWKNKRRWASGYMKHSWVWRECDAPNLVIGHRSNLVQLFMGLYAASKINEMNLAKALAKTTDASGGKE